MKYRVGNTFYGKDWDDGFKHYGVRGMSWGKRRFQNLDGSLTSLGYRHYGVGEGQPNFGRNIQSEMRSRSLGGASQPVRTTNSNPYYTQRFASTKSVSPLAAVNSRYQQRQNAQTDAQTKKDMANVSSHYQQRKEAVYRNSPQGKAEAFLNKVGEGAQRVGEQAQKIGKGLDDIGWEASYAARSTANKVKDAVGNAVDNARGAVGLKDRDKYMSAIGSRQHWQNEYNHAVRNTNNAKEAANRWNEYADEKEAERYAENVNNKRGTQSWFGTTLADKMAAERAAKAAYDQTPVGRVENFANQVGQGAQNAWNQTVNGMQQFGQNIGNLANQVGQNVGNFANQVGKDAQNTWNAAINGLQQLPNQIDRGLNLGVETGRILDAARQNRDSAQGAYDASRARYDAASNIDPNRTSGASQIIGQQFQDAASQLVNAQKSVDAWEQQYGGTVIGGVRNAIQQGANLLNDLLSRLFRR